MFDDKLYANSYLLVCARLIATSSDFFSLTRCFLSCSKIDLSKVCPPISHLLRASTLVLLDSAEPFLLGGGVESYSKSVKGLGRLSSCIGVLKKSSSVSATQPFDLGGVKSSLSAVVVRVKT